MTGISYQHYVHLDETEGNTLSISDWQGMKTNDGFDDVEVS